MSNDNSLTKEETMKRPNVDTFPRAGPINRFSRRHFVGVTAAAAGVTLGSGLWTPAVRADDDEQGDNANGQCPDAEHIPHINSVTKGLTGGCANMHFFFPGHADGTATATDPEGAHPNGRDPSTIFDFDGVIGQADLTLTGTGTDLTTGATAPYGFHTDMRFMSGKFRAPDGSIRHGSWAFI
ncbi:MAG: hypothetical protein DMF58_09225 [Acidobacteria bacterium]|nr:MAG: hypothetical protein DMF58_09225 [Acidobacteriota bacterium]